MTDGISQELLTSRSQKHDILREMGIDVIYEIEFNERIMRLSPEAFVVDFLVGHLKAKGVVVGYDYRFGFKASGDVNTLDALCKAHNLDLAVKKPSPTTEKPYPVRAFGPP